MSSKLDIIVSQTDYTNEIAIEKLNKFNGNHIKVIQEYMGINTSDEHIPKSHNQEIYKQFRKRLNESAISYNDKKYEQIHENYEIAKKQLLEVMQDNDNNITPTEKKNETKSH